LIEIHLTKSQRGIGGDAIKVLHINEDPVQLDCVKRFLEEREECLEIESIASPDEILSMILNGTFDAILANYGMLERKGIEFEERVRRSHRARLSHGQRGLGPL